MHLRAERFIALQILFDLLNRVDDRRVISSAKQSSDLDQRQIEELANEKHGDLTGHGELLGSLLGHQAFHGDIPARRHALANRARRELRGYAAIQDAAERLACEV